MTRVRKFFRLSPSEHRLLARALIAVGSVRIGLWCLPFRVLRPVLDGFAERKAERTGRDDSTDRVAWAVRAAARCVPRATCLTQALAAQMLLARQGEESALHIGVAREAGRSVRAHAWLEARGNIVLGGETSEGYLPLALVTRSNSPSYATAPTAPRTEVV